MNELEMISPFLWVIIVALLLIQASWIFYDAQRRGENKWLWGLFGLLNVPSNLIIYLIVTRIVMKTRECPLCKKSIREDSMYCPYCGEKVKEE